MRIAMSWLGCALLLSAPVHAQSTREASTASEEQAVRVPLEHYLQGHATGDGAHFRAAFHPEARLFFIRDGRLSTRTSEEYIAGARGTPPADEAQRKRWIESVDIAGNAAVAKIILDYPTTRFVDYMSLLKIEGAWKIVNKTFYAEPRSSGKP
ncbi:MAG TPA: nuclear transport factor 2 family protein [Burkholderiales bacterium]|nr:nuclear transport factor 2 family protein [Burkholderiales bacterium]